VLPDNLDRAMIGYCLSKSSLAQIETRSEQKTLQILVVDDQPDVCEIPVVLQVLELKVTDCLLSCGGSD